MNPKVLVVIVIVSASRREPPSSSVLSAAPAIDTTGEPLSEASRPLRNVVPLRSTLRKVG